MITTMNSTVGIGFQNRNRETRQFVSVIRQHGRVGTKIEIESMNKHFVVV